MTRKSAVSIAGGIAAALVAGLVAVSINMGILRASGDPAGPGKLTSTPIVKTEIQTIRHKAKSGRGDQPTKTVVIPRPESTIGSSSSASSSHQFESEPEHEFGENDDD